MDSNESLSTETIDRMCQQAFSHEEIEQRAVRYGQILPHTHERMRTPCKVVDQEYIESGEIFPLVAMMRFVLRESKGVGLAANQVGNDRRIILLRYENAMIIMVNPEIGILRGRSTMVEKCLSVHEGRPGYAVKRAKKLSIRFDTFREIDGEVSLGNASGKIDGLAAAVFQHEVQHLNGIDITMVGKLVSEPNRMEA